MNYWYEFPCDFVTIEYGRYEAVRDISKIKWHGCITWTPVLAGPRPDPLVGLSAEEYEKATTPC